MELLTVAVHHFIVDGSLSSNNASTYFFFVLWLQGQLVFLVLLKSIKRRFFIFIFCVVV